jgi:hypothetical protein
VPACPYDAYLRVYEPLEAFPPGERERWASYVADPRRRDRAVGVSAARWESLRNLAATPPIVVPSSESQDAFVLDVDGRPLVCPWDTRLRAWLALDELRDDLPGPVLAVVAPPSALAAFEEEEARWRREHPDAHPRILTSTWHVPLWWFVAFGAQERRLHLHEPRELVYRTPMGQARRRIARGLRTLRRTVEDSVLTAAVETLGRWLEEFHPSSWVELDYGGLARLLPADHLETDTSAQDVADGLTALADGDVVRAGQCYERLIDRWRAVAAYEHAS